uniref:Uncharacterized protein n=1 Tax=Cacopsylla melanoneura TaxID=428564 RepID=A0A8D8M1K9_9HEMI
MQAAGQLQQGTLQQGQLQQGQLQQGQLQQGQLQQGQIQQVQVIQNQQTAYLPQLYGGQGGLIMPGNMQIGPMKVITQGQPGTYPTYPGTSNQTLVIGQLFSPQQNLLPGPQNNQSKPQDMKPPTQGCVVSSQGQQLTHLISPIQYSNNGRTTVQSNQMQFTPWQFNALPQGITWASPQQPIFIQGRGTQQDGSGQPQQGTPTPTPMFLQQSPPPQHIQTHQQVAMQQGATLPQLSSTPTTIKTRPEHIQPKTLNTICRPLMPNSVRGGPALNSNQGTLGPKKRTKSVVLRAPLVIPTQKMMDASNQTKLQTSIQQQINNSNNKMIITSTGQLIHHHQQQQHLTNSVAPQQQQQQIVHASLAGQHMGNTTTQLTYTMQQQPLLTQPKPIIGVPIQTQQIVNPQQSQQQQQLQQQHQQQQQQQHPPRSEEVTVPIKGPTTRP